MILVLSPCLDFASILFVLVEFLNLFGCFRIGSKESQDLLHQSDVLCVVASSTLTETFQPNDHTIMARVDSLCEYPQEEEFSFRFLFPAPPRTMLHKEWAYRAFAEAIVGSLWIRDDCWFDFCF